MTNTNPMAMAESTGLDERSRCCGKNGDFAISSLTARCREDGMAEIKFVSRILKRELNAGATVGAEDLDRFCRAWMTARGDASAPKEMTRDDRLRRASQLAAQLMRDLKEIEPLDQPEQKP